MDAGHTLIYKDGEVNIERYYKLEFPIKKEEYDKSVNKISKVMEDSVQHHMISDVEVGSFLSSGIDSSYLVSLARPDKTYTVGYDIPRYNEIDYAKDLASRLDINNTSKKRIDK